MVTTKNFSDSKGEGVKNALGTVTINKAMMDYFKGRQEEWKSFGKMNSHLYRGKLFDRMEKMKLSAEAKMLIYAMSSVIKSQPRIVQAMIELPEAERFASSGVWFAVRNFFETECTQYVSAAKKNQKFPVVNIPTTMPGLDILWFCFCTKNEERTVDTLKIRPTFSQIFLQADVQTIAKQGYEIFWTQIVKGSRNPDKVDSPSMREDFYQTSASDSYLLVEVNKDSVLVEKEPSNKQRGYSLAEIEAYLRSFD